MTFDITHGPLGRRGVHTWNTGAAVLNDRASTRRGPRVAINKVTGLRKRPDSDDPREANVGRSGETPRPRFKRGKTLVYEGWLQAPTESELYQLCLDVMEAFAIDDTGLMTIAPATGVTGPTWRYTARVTDCDIDDSTVMPSSALPTRWQWPITLSLRMADSRFYLDDEVSVGSIASGVVHTVTNDGRADTDPIITVTLDDPGVATELVLVNSTLEDGLLRFDLPATVDGIDLTGLRVDFAARSARVIKTGGSEADGIRFLNVPLSRWWDEHVPGLQPGGNDIDVDGGSWILTFRPAVW
jgi:hypothetical protein